MVKQIIFCITCYCFCSIAVAQHKAISYGFQTGLTINSAAGTAVNDDAKSALIGFSAGGHYNILLKKHLSFKMRLAYERNGWMYRNLMYAPGTANTFFKLNYLNLPVLLEWSFGDKIKFYYDAGVFAGALLSNTITVKYTGISLPSESFSSDYRRTMNFGVSTGAGLQVPLTNHLKLDVSLNNNFGLSNINKGPNNNNTSVGTIKTNAFSMLAGLTFALR